MHIVKVLSDIHLEYYKNYPGINYFIPDDQDIDIICLCGDIGYPESENYLKFLKDCVDRCRLYTFVIMGNHEAYNKTIENTETLISNICIDINNIVGSEKIIFLNNSTFDIPEYRFIGTTLWSDIDPTYAWHIRSNISDFKYIKNWSIGDSKEKFQENVIWLRMMLQQAEEDDIKVIIMTHYAPLLTLGDMKYGNTPLKSAFNSDLSELIKMNTNIISYWFYGHNHYSESVNIYNTTILSNQRGYKDECSETNYNYNMIITI